MKFRYFLRGLGVGIIFASIIFLAAYRNDSGKKMSEAEIIKQAKKLGMVEADHSLDNILATDTQGQSSEAQVTESTEKTSENTIEQVTEEKTTEATTEETTEATTQEQTESEKTEATTETKDKIVKVKVERGTSSYPVCQKLQELGLITDAAEFDDYLVKNGYASRIRVGEHSLKIGMSYHEIAEAISDPL